MDSTLSRQLVQAGLGRTQADAYLALTALGDAGAAEVARQAGMPRTSAYAALAALASAGLVTTTMRGRRKRFVAAPPKALLELPRRQESLLRSLLGDIGGLARRNQTRPRIAVHEGKAGIIHVNELLLSARSRSYCYVGSSREMVDAMGEEYLRDYVRRRVARGIRVRAVRVRGSEAKLDCLGSGARWLREVRYLDRPVDRDLVSLYVWDDRVSITSTIQEGFGIVIDSAECAAMVRLMWETLWEVARPA